MIVKIKATEPEFNSLVIGWLNEFIIKGHTPFELCTHDTSIHITANKKKIKKPDVSLWINRAAKIAFASWELKTPTTDIRDTETLKKGAEKAKYLHAMYLVTWNMRESIIWQIPKEGDIKNEDAIKTYSILTNILNVEDITNPLSREKLKERCHEIFSDLTELYIKGHIHSLDLDATFFVKKLKNTAESLFEITLRNIENSYDKKKIFAGRLEAWARQQGISTIDKSYLESLSRQLIYRLLARIIFYVALQRFATHLPKLMLEDVKPEKVNESLLYYFEKARRFDYQAVFERDFSDEIPLGEKVGEIISELIKDFNIYNFSTLNVDVLGSIFEDLIPQEEQHLLGQYYTPTKLVDLITSFCVEKKDSTVLDPTCGTGTFLIRAYDRKIFLGNHDHTLLLSQIWGIDIGAFPVSLATINLYRQNIGDYNNFPRVFKKDFFEVKPEAKHLFPPPRPGINPEQKIEQKMPLFDAVIGNFPYIRQELIEKNHKGYKNKITQVLINEWNGIYPDIRKKNHELTISGQADIYAYMFFHAAAHLKEGGRMGIVTSNAWLDVSYGYELQKYFLKNFKIIAILESRCEPWFEKVSINTIVTILERCSDKIEREKHKARFVKIKKKLDVLIQEDTRTKAHDRWRHLSSIVRLIENASERKGDEKNTTIFNYKDISSYENEEFRIRLVSQEQLLSDLEESRKTSKWGQYLRAPDVYFEILNRCKNSLVTLKEIADFNFGIKTGINEFFYLTDDKIKHWGIENEFLVPILTSPKEISNMYLSPEKLKHKLFNCNYTKTDLTKLRKINARKYIVYNETQYSKTRKGHKKGGEAFPDVPSVRHRKIWYSLGDLSPGHFIINRFISERFVFPINKNKVAVGDVVFEGKYKKKKDIFLKSLLMNSTLFYLFTELSGRVNLGEGLLTFYGPDIQETYVIDTGKIKKDIKEKIVENGKRLAERKVLSIYEEIKMKDRIKFDELILKSLGLPPKQYLHKIYNELICMVKERIELSKSRKIQIKNKVKKEYNRICEEFADEILPFGPKEFPDDFVTIPRAKNKINEVQVPEEKLNFGNIFFGKQEIIANNYKYECYSDVEAKFIIYAQKPNEFFVIVPKDERLIIKAVISYEKYLIELKDKIFSAFMNRTGYEHQLSERLTNIIWSKYNLPEILS